MGDATCIVHAVFRAPEPARFGFIVSKAVGNAVQRNLVRRRLKTIADRQLQRGLSDVDVVIRARPESLKAPFVELEREVNRSIDRLLRKAERAAEGAAPREARP